MLILFQSSRHFIVMSMSDYRCTCPARTYVSETRNLFVGSSLFWINTLHETEPVM
jgi:hypothetical protein